MIHPAFGRRYRVQGERLQPLQSSQGCQSRVRQVRPDNTQAFEVREALQILDIAVVDLIAIDTQVLQGREGGQMLESGCSPAVRVNGWKRDIQSLEFPAASQESHSFRAGRDVDDGLQLRKAAQDPDRLVPEAPAEFDGFELLQTPEIFGAIVVEPRDANEGQLLQPDEFADHFQGAVGQPGAGPERQPLQLRQSFQAADLLVVGSTLTHQAKLLQVRQFRQVRQSGSAEMVDLQSQHSQIAEPGQVLQGGIRHPNMAFAPLDAGQLRQVRQVRRNRPGSRPEFQAAQRAQTREQMQSFSGHTHADDAENPQAAQMLDLLIHVRLRRREPLARADAEHEQVIRPQRGKAGQITGICVRQTEYHAPVRRDRDITLRQSRKLRIRDRIADICTSPVNGQLPVQRQRPQLDAADRAVAREVQHPLWSGGFRPPIPHHRSTYQAGQHNAREQTAHQSIALSHGIISLDAMADPDGSCSRSHIP